MFPSSAKPASGGAFGGFATSSTTLSYLTPPPDFSSIPHDAIVPFKNLLKKASATKEKALQDILGYVQGLGPDGQGLDEPVIGAYIALYPRLSIDDSARVRELSHQLLFQLLTTAKKRMAKQLSTFVGPWLAGTFDRDKRVARVAGDALSSFLQTKEKQTAFWKAVQTRALDFATEAINETPATLSDERSTTKQDALAKYHRVVGASFSLALNLVRRGDLAALEGGLSRYLGVDAIWTMSKVEDAFVRRSFYQFLHVLLETKPEVLEPRLKEAGRALVADALKSSQTGSATDLLQVLAALTRRFPQVWGSQRHPLQRLQPFISQGSQGGAEEYWRALDSLLQALPDKSPSSDIVSAFLGSMRKGIADRLEARASRHQAFHSYAGVFELFLGRLPLSESFLDENLSGVTLQYFHPALESPLPSPQRPDFLAEAWMTVANHPDDETRNAVALEWQKMGSAFLSRMSNSLPEVSEGYEKSQSAIASEGERWFAFAHQVLSPGGKAGSLRDVMTASSAEVLRGALDLLVRRNFKPFGAASVIQSAFRHCPGLCSDNDLLVTLFPQGQPEVYANIVASKSLPFLVSDLHITSGDHLGAIWTSLADAALVLPDLTSAIHAVRVLIAVPSIATHAQQLAPLQAFLISAWKQYTAGEATPGLKDLCEAALSFDALTKDSSHAVAADILCGLDSPETRLSALSALELMLHKRPELGANSDLHVRLVTSLLAITELSEADLSKKARRLRSLLDNEAVGQNPISSILESHLAEASPSSLDIDTLVQQALAALESGKVSAEDVFPSTTVWMDELSSFLTLTPPRPLSVTSSLGGAYFLVQGNPNTKVPIPGRDSSGRAAPARMALLTAKLLSAGVQLSGLPPEFQLELVYLLCLAEVLATDQLAAVQSGGLWNGGLDTDTRIQEFCDLSSAAVQNVAAGCGGWLEWTMTGDSLVERLVKFMLQQASGMSPGALYTAKALSSLLQVLVKVHGGPPAQLEEWLNNIGVMKVTPNTALPAAAILTGFGDTLVSSRVVSTLCTRLISDMSGIPGTAMGLTRTLSSLVLLNLCMDVYEAGQVPVETRKQVLALQQFTRWMDEPEQLGSYLAAETCKAITRMLPATKDTYGPYWEKVVEFCLWLWKKADKDSPEERLPYLHASLRLMQALHALDDANDDLEDALQSHRADESAALLRLLSIPREGTTTLPGELVDAMLARAVNKISDVKLADLGGVYESVASESREIQNAAFGLLHRALPAAQEDINLAVVLDKKAANLPDELLSLLLNAPNSEEYSDEDLARFPVAIRSYLLAWHLVFDAYSKASFRVRSDYTDNLKSGKNLDPLLRFLVDVLGHALGRALDLDKERFTPDHIRSYSIALAEAEPPERDMHWLLIHLFYLVLKYLPGLFKMWYLECPSKQTKNAVQSWMERFFSPLIISDALDEVVEWSAKQESGDADTEEIVVKVSKTSREITAGYPVDEDAATIALHVPKSFPLDPVDVVSVKRVAVKEDKWQSWLKATKAMIMFGNCSIVDGLMTFRRNISLALKGQEECAICYSIIATDKTLPDKKCGTCSHAFHRVCLYKWFQNSGRNTCPLCRNAIDYLGSDTRERRKAGAGA